jgi:hypothetical protein
MSYAEFLLYISENSVNKQGIGQWSAESRKQIAEMHFSSSEICNPYSVTFNGGYGGLKRYVLINTIRYSFVFNLTTEQGLPRKLRLFAMTNMRKVILIF